MKISFNLYILIVSLLCSCSGIANAYDKEDYFKEQEIAADRGEADGQFNFALLLSIDGRRKEAAKYYKLAAIQGHLGALHELGQSYEFGSGVIKSYKTAEETYLLAAEQGYAKSQEKLGDIASNKKRDSYNLKTAIKWYHKAALQGHEGSQYKLGRLYSDKHNKQTNYFEAYVWLSLAASTGRRGAKDYRNSVAKELSQPKLAKAQDKAYEIYSLLNP